MKNKNQIFSKFYNTWNSGYLKKVWLKIFKEKLMCAIAFNHHDSSASFSLDNKVVLFLEAERFFRKKKMKCSHEEMEYLVRYEEKGVIKKVSGTFYFIKKVSGTFYFIK